jgi:23S rRNA pseudouridine2605 synthase
MPKMRINRALAAAGVASRRGAEELIRAGRVSVNGAVISELATQIDPQRETLMVDGKPVAQASPVYYLFYKPRGMVSTAKDERGRSCVGDICHDLEGMPQPVGRLDRASEGLMLLTNDGEAALRLSHPRYGISKEYLVTIQPPLTDRDARRLTTGVELEDGPAVFVGISLRSQEHGRSRLAVTVAEGRYRIIRRALESLGYEVLRLKRVRLGGLTLGELKPGQTRQLTVAEAKDLRRTLKIDVKKPAAPRTDKKKPGDGPKRPPTA